MVGSRYTCLCHSVRLFRHNEYQKFLTRVFFLIHISTGFCSFPFNILGKEFVSKKRNFKRRERIFGDVAVEALDLHSEL